MINLGELLKTTASVTPGEDWEYSRDLGDIKRIRMKGDYSGYDAIWNRILHAIKSSWEYAKGKPHLGGTKRLSIKERVLGILFTLKLYLRTDRNLPDGTVSGKILTYWEEDGEYLQLVQPSVGRLLADFLIECPEHPHAILILEELDRIQANYLERIKNGDVCRTR